MRLLAVTNMYPTAEKPTGGIFVQQQVESLRSIGVAVDVLAVDRASSGRWAYWNAGRQVRSRVRAFRPDVVHVMYGGVIADITTAAAERTPVVVSFCGSDLLGSSLSGLAARFSARYGIFASHRAARKAAGIVVKSKNLKDALPPDVEASKVRIIPNGIDLTRFTRLDRRRCRLRLGWNDHIFHVLFATNAGDPCKRPELARAAVRALMTMGVAAELHHMSGVPHDEVPVWLNASDALLLTSLTEGSPNIVKEALACDLPVVSVDVGDVREQLRGVDGCHLAHPEPGDLAARLRTVHAGPARIAGRARIQELSVERVACRVQDFYEDVVRSREGGGSAR